MDVKTLVKRYPRLYHMAECDTWPSIRDRGLYSTSAVLDKFGISGTKRFELESKHRPEKVTIGEGPERIVLRDQKPMETSRLEAALENGITPRQWYETINRKVFFWVQEHRLFGLLNARPYKKIEHDVLTLDTASLVAAHEDEIWLCRMNSGNTFPFPHPRNLSDFHRVADYPAKSNGAPVKEVVELVVDYAVPDVGRYVIEVRRMVSDKTLAIIPLS